MSCVISSPSSDSGKTTLSLLLSCWAFSKGIKIQTFKVGPDYLDQQQLSSIGQPICRNLDIFLSGEEWVKESFFKHSLKYEFSLIEGAMGLFDGLGSTTYSSTADVSKLLNAPVIFIVNARGQVASLLATVRGFRDFDSELSISGIIFNNVNSDRHKKLIKEVFKNEDIEILGFLPSDSKITLNKANLGLISPLDNGKEIDVEYFANFAERNLDVFSLIKFLKSPQKTEFNSVFFKDFILCNCYRFTFFYFKIFKTDRIKYFLLRRFQKFNKREHIKIFFSEICKIFNINFSIIIQWRYQT